MAAVRPLLWRWGGRGMAFLQPAIGRGSLWQPSKAALPAGMGNRRTMVASRPLEPGEHAGIVQKAVPGDSRTPVSDERTGLSGFRIESERELFRRHLTIWERIVRFPDGKVVSFDVLGNERSNFQSVFVFPFDSKSGTVTVLQEYCPGVNDVQLSFVAGMFESKKHASLEEAARAELSEEAHLKGGKLVPLCDDHGGISADKYSKNMFHFFLCLDSEQDESPKDLDGEEWITIIPGYSLGEIRRMIVGGRFNTPSSLLGMLALDELRRMGYE